MATLLIDQFVKEKIPVKHFLEEYDNFYYYEALDGHEADDAQKMILDEFNTVIAFHKEIQLGIVDLVYIGNDKQKQQYLQAGRLDMEEVLLKVKALADQYDINKLFKIMGLS